MADRSRQHDGKRIYLTAAQAKRAAKQVVTMTGGRPMTAYKCPHACDLGPHWHVGHPARHWQIDAARKLAAGGAM